METATLIFLGFIVLQRLSELVIAKRNTAKLLAKGAYEVGASHYPVMVAMHSAWIACLLVFGYDEAVLFGWLAAFVVLQGFRLWILTSLGGRWTPMVLGLVWVAVVFTVLNAAMLWVRIGVEHKALAPLRAP